MSLVLWILAGAAGLILLLAAFKLTRKRPPVAGARGPVRYTRAAFETAPKPKPKPALNFRLLGLWLAVLIIVVWVGFSLASRTPSQPPQVSAREADPAGPPAGSGPAAFRLAPTVSRNLTGPAPDGPIPELAPPPPPPAPAPAPAPPAVPPPAPAQAEPQSAGGPGLFTPDPAKELPSLMVTAAQSMAPVISRMEPLARSLKKPDQESEAAPAKPASKPAARPAERPRPARIPAPPLAQAAPPAEASPAPAPIPAPAAGSGPPLNERQKYTVLLGAFGKEENALNLKARMEAAGLPAAISEVTDKNKLWFRVMSGTFEDRSSADAYGRELRLRKLVDRPYVKPL